MKPITGKFVKDVRKAMKMTQKQLADRIGADQGLVSRWEREELTPSTKYALYLFHLAREAGLREDAVTPLGSGGAPPRAYRIVGQLQAGVWMEAIEWAYEDQREVHVTPPPGLEYVDVQGFEVRGTSMNAVYPHGTLVFVQPTISNNIIPKSGQHVLVSRRNKSGLYEATLKEYVKDEDGRVWLWPRSTDPKHQAPIALDDGESEEVTVTGIVRFSVLRAP